jgi:hypothetical protein
MRVASICALVAIMALAARPARAQFTAGVGAGVGTGSRGGDAKATHGVGFLEFKLPVLPGVRADGYVVDAPSGVGKFSLAVSAVLSAPLPVIKPYLIAGWGKYGIDKSATSQSGWNAGAGVRASFGVGVFAEYRRHQRIGRDLVTVGLTF